MDILYTRREDEVDTDSSFSLKWSGLDASRSGQARTLDISMHRPLDSGSVVVITTNQPSRSQGYSIMQQGSQGSQKQVIFGFDDLTGWYLVNLDGLTGEDLESFVAITESLVSEEQREGGDPLPTELSNLLDTVKANVPRLLKGEAKFCKNVLECYEKYGRKAFSKSDGCHKFIGLVGNEIQYQGYDRKGCHEIIKRLATAISRTDVLVGFSQKQAFISYLVKEVAKMENLQKDSGEGQVEQGPLVDCIEHT